MKSTVKPPAGKEAPATSAGTSESRATLEPVGMLTPSEIEQLRQEMKASSAAALQAFKKDPPIAPTPEEEERIRAIHRELEVLWIESINDSVLAERTQRLKALMEEFIAECRLDPRFLDRALKTLKPMRGKGHSKRPQWHDAAVDGIISACQGWPPGEIVKAIATTMQTSESNARRLYDQALRRSK